MYEIRRQHNKTGYFIVTLGEGVYANIIVILGCKRAHPLRAFTMFWTLAFCRIYVINQGHTSFYICGKQIER